MAAAVNAVNDCFSIGSTVMCTTCFNEEVEGEVLAFDHNTKMLILKCQSKTSEDLSDVFVLNLSLCSNVQVIKESNGNLLVEPQKLNLEQVKIRLRKTVQLRQTYLKSKNVDVSPEAQELYRAIAKQFKENEVFWQGQNIQILKGVTIMPPYKAENVISSSNDNEKLCDYIKKVIYQFFNARPDVKIPITTSASSTSVATAIAVTSVVSAVSTTSTSTVVSSTLSSSPSIVTTIATNTVTAIVANTTTATTPIAAAVTTMPSTNNANAGHVSNSSSSSSASPTLSSNNAASGSPVPAN